MNSIGEVLRSFFVDYLPIQRGLRTSTVKSYRDALRLFLQYSSQELKRKITKLEPEHLTMELVVGFLNWLEEHRKTSARTRNHRLAALHIFFEYLALRMPELVGEAKRVAAIRSKRCHPAETFYLDQEEISLVLKNALSDGKAALSVRDRALLLFMYNTGARVQEIAELRSDQLDLSGLRVRLHGKGDKWRLCPLWKETAIILKEMLSQHPLDDPRPVFVSRNGEALTRFGIYKIVRRHTNVLCKKRLDGTAKAISPHVFRHTTAVHLLESGVELNVIRAWLGHVSLDTTNRYAEITIRTKLAALDVCQPPVMNETHHRSTRWREDEELLKWLDSL